MIHRSRSSREFKTARCVLVYRDAPCADEQFLLAVHSSFWAKREQRWGLPGGAIERREDPHTAARREIQEELNLDIPELIPVGPFPYKGADHMIFTAVIDEAITQYDKRELLDLKWFSYAEVSKLSQDAKLHAGYELLAVQQALTSLRAP